MLLAGVLDPALPPQGVEGREVSGTEGFPLTLLFISVYVPDVSHA